MSRGMAQVVDSLPSKSKALVQTLLPQKKKKKPLITQQKDNPQQAHENMSSIIHHYRNKKQNYNQVILYIHQDGYNQSLSTNVDNDIEKLKPFCTAGRSCKMVQPLWKSCTVPQKVKQS
jgi:hypothetical protein